MNHLESILSKNNEVIEQHNIANNRIAMRLKETEEFCRRIIQKNKNLTEQVQRLEKAIIEKNKGNNNG